MLYVITQFLSLISSCYLFYLFIFFKKAQTEGQKSELGQIIASLRTELNKEFYRDVDKKYKDKLIALKVTFKNI